MPGAAEAFKVAGSVSWGVLDERAGDRRTDRDGGD